MGRAETFIPPNLTPTLLHPHPRQPSKPPSASHPPSSLPIRPSGSFLDFFAFTFLIADRRRLEPGSRGVGLRRKEGWRMRGRWRREMKKRRRKKITAVSWLASCRSAWLGSARLSRTGGTKAPPDRPDRRYLHSACSDRNVPAPLPH